MGCGFCRSIDGLYGHSVSYLGSDAFNGYALSRFETRHDDEVFTVIVGRYLYRSRHYLVAVVDYVSEAYVLQFVGGSLGYDDYLYPEYGDSRITTYLVDMAEMSKIALSCVIRRIENVSMNASVHIVNGRIIERTSVKKIN